VISHTTQKFRQLYAALPESLRRQTQSAYIKFKDNPNHPELRFKCVHPEKRIYSARINSEYRALGVLAEDVIIWFWVGSHDEYLRLLHP